MGAYDELSFSDVEAFYAKHVQGRPVAIMVVGDPRVVKLEQLRSYGPVVKLRARDLLSP